MSFSPSPMNLDTGGAATDHHRRRPQGNPEPERPVPHPGGGCSQGSPSCVARTRAKESPNHVRPASHARPPVHATSIGRDFGRQAASPPGGGQRVVIAAGRLLALMLKNASRHRQDRTGHQRGLRGRFGTQWQTRSGKWTGERTSKIIVKLNQKRRLCLNYTSKKKLREKNLMLTVAD